MLRNFNVGVENLQSLRTCSEFQTGSVTAPVAHGRRNSQESHAGSLIFDINSTVIYDACPLFIDKLF